MHALCIKLRHTVLQIDHQPLRCLGGQRGLLRLLMQLLQTGFVWQLNGMAILPKPLAPRGGLTRQLFYAALFGRQHTNLVLHLADLGPLLIGQTLGQAQCIFQLWQLYGVVLQLGGQQLGFFAANKLQLRQVLQFQTGILVALGPLRCLLCQSLQT